LYTSSSYVFYSSPKNSINESIILLLPVFEYALDSPLSQFIERKEKNSFIREFSLLYYVKSMWEIFLMQDSLKFQTHHDEEAKPAIFV